MNDLNIVAVVCLRVFEISQCIGQYTSKHSLSSYDYWGSRTDSRAFFDNDDDCRNFFFASGPNDFAITQNLQKYREYKQKYLNIYAHSRFIGQLMAIDDLYGGWNFCLISNKYRTVLITISDQ